jgi:hypothetical protein
MIMQKTTTQYLFKPILFLAVAMAGIISLIGSGGGGGDDVSGGGGTYSLLPAYAFRISGVDEPLDAWPTGVSVTLDENDSTHYLRIDPQSLEGSFSCDPVTEVCELASIDTTTHVYVGDESTPETLFGDFSINILTQLVFDTTTDAPISGSVQLAQEGGLGFITIDVTLCSGTPGVEIVDDGVLLGCYTWQQFDELMDTSAVAAEQASAMAYGVLEFLLELANITALNSFDLMEYDLENLGNVTLSCDSFSSAGLSPPSPIAAWDQGEVIFHFIDENADLTMGPGDSFGYIFNFCWENDPTDNIDDLFSGIIELISFTESVNASDLLIRIGYEGTTSGKTGGVFFDNFVWYETEPDATPPTTSFVSQMTLNGGMSVVFFEP